MTWMLTANGAVVDLRFIRPGSEISILDIAHHLSQINRYTGASKRPYSVAEHSLLVAEIMEREMGVRSPAHLLCGLLHDAHEAYTNDLSSPMKQVLRQQAEMRQAVDQWAVIERMAQTAVLARWLPPQAWEQCHEQVHAADMHALSTERAALLPEAGPQWPCMHSHPPIGWARLDLQSDFTWDDWRQTFVERFGELHYALHHGAAA